VVVAVSSESQAGEFRKSWYKEMLFQIPWAGAHWK